MITDKTILGIKYACVITELSARTNLNLLQAMDKFYKSYTYQEMREGISDMHCRSDAYLVEEIMREV